MLPLDVYLNVRQKLHKKVRLIELSSVCKFCVLCAGCQRELGGGAHNTAVSEVTEAPRCASGAVDGGALPEPGAGARQGAHTTS